MYDAQQIRNKMTGVVRGSTAVAVLAVAATMTLTACSKSDNADAEKAVHDYMTAVAAGDSVAAHGVDPYSPILTDEGAAASTAGVHLEVVKVGSFEPIAEGLDASAAAAAAATAKKAEAAAKSKSSDSSNGWLGIDWSDQSWNGAKAEKGDSLKAVETVTQGVVAVTYSLGDATVTVPIGIAYGRDDKGVMKVEFRSFTLSAEQAAKYGTAEAVPALAPAAIVLDTTDAADATAAAAAADKPSWWDETMVDVKDATRKKTTRTASLAAASVTLSDESALLVLPGVYSLAVGAADGADLWASPASPEPTTLTLGPGDEGRVALGAPVVTAAGKAEVQTQVAQIASDKFDLMTAFKVSDRDQSCGALAPTSSWTVGAKNAFEDDWMTSENSNLASGGIKVDAVSDNGAVGSASGNGSKDTFADEAFCAGKSSADTKDAYMNAVKVLSLSLTPGKVTVADDGTFTTVTPWTLSMTTTVSAYSSHDAGGNPVGYGKNPVTTTYTATVAINWEPQGTLARNGEIKAGK
jgi:hypothetical protein